jgi:hypothetical protein
MTIVVPRPQMRRRERRNIEARLRRHAEFMAALEKQGMPRKEASSEAMRMLEREEALQPPCNTMLIGQDRIAADRMWRDAAQRKIFEAETGLTEPGTEEYETRFREWAAARIALMRPQGKMKWTSE